MSFLSFSYIKRTIVISAIKQASHFNFSEIPAFSGMMNLEYIDNNKPFYIGLAIVLCDLMVSRKVICKL